MRTVHNDVMPRLSGARAALPGDMLYCYILGMKVALALAVLLALAPAPGARAADGKIAVVAAENFYGDIARQIAGAQIAIVNGADYDPWMEKLLSAAPQPNRKVIVAAELVHRQAGDNPHLWYDPATMPAVAKAIAAALSAADAAHKSNYAARLATFLGSLKPLDDRIAAIRGKYAGTAVTASEPVFGYMAAALGLKMRNERFQLSIMNDTEPSAHDVAAFQGDLKTHKVRIMFYNKQASNKAVQTLVDLAHAFKIPVVGVTETAPPGLSYQEWMLTQLNDTERALKASSL